MDISRPITVFYDQSCALCAAEIHSLKTLDIEARLQLVDCSSKDFDDTPYRAEGIDRQAMMNALHIKASDGYWHKGVAAFELLYKTVGLPWIGTLWNHPVTRPFTTRFYPWVVRNRYTLSKLGLPRAMEWLGKVYAIRAHQNAKRCKGGRCQTTHF